MEKNIIYTVIHMYYFNLDNKDDRNNWNVLKARLSNGPSCMHSRSYNKHRQQEYHYDPSRDGTNVPLETSTLFDNQWNASPIPEWDVSNTSGYRLFDWARDAVDNPKIVQGYYLDQTPEMIEIRNSRVVCKYCGHQEPAAKGYVFCDKCLNSKYLNEEDLYLVRMVSVKDQMNPLRPLTEAEKNYLLPLYKEAQKRNVDILRKKLINDRDEAIAHEKTECDGMLWLLDHGLKIDNVIYYKHTGKFCFGWSKPITDEEKSKILGIISEFLWPYEIKCADGKKLEGY